MFIRALLLQTKLPEALGNFLKKLVKHFFTRHSQCVKQKFEHVRQWELSLTCAKKNHVLTYHILLIRCLGGTLWSGDVVLKRTTLLTYFEFCAQDRLYYFYVDLSKRILSHISRVQLVTERKIALRAFYYSSFLINYTN